MTTAQAWPAILVQERPPILVSVIPGPWLLKCTTPSWRIEDPEEGFQRRVNEERARKIAAEVLDQRRSFPNAIVLATDRSTAPVGDGLVSFPKGIRFLVVDGQHRLWAQKYSEYEAQYCCVIHLGLSEKDMARTFIEINDNQKRVPSSLAWDLVRLIREDEDSADVRASDLLYELATAERSALYQRIDLTGEQKELKIKQGSLAPAIRSSVAGATSALAEESFDTQAKLLLAYFEAIRNCDADRWKKATSPLYENRVLRAMLKLLPEIVTDIEKPTDKIRSQDLGPYLSRIKLESLDKQKIVEIQGNAGIAAIYRTIRAQVL